MIDSKKRAHGPVEPSPWVTRFAPLISTDGEVLDLACGSGRHTRYILDRNHKVTALDKDISKASDLASNPNVYLVQADLEITAPWPFPDKKFSGIIVTNYLYRPLFPILLAALAEGGILIYETFAIGNEQYGPPRNPAFLLKKGELLEYAKGHLNIVAFEQGVVEGVDHPKVIQRVCARKDKSFKLAELPTNPR
jgi:SAM-dependent methyltransferase